MALFSFRSKPKGDYDYFSTAIFSPSRNYSVSEEQAMSIPAVKASVELISSTIASLPIYLYEELQNSDVTEINYDKRVALLNESPNKIDTGFKIKKLIAKDLLLYGKAYLYKKNGGLHYLHAKKVKEKYLTIDEITVESKEFIYSDMKTVTFSEDVIITFDNGTEGILVDGSSILQQALNELEYSKNVISNGAIPVGILKAASRLTEPAINRLRTSFESLYSGSKKAGKTIILEEGLDFSPAGLNPNDLQLNETSKTTLASITRLFNLPQAMIDSSANKYASLEMQNMQFLQFTINPLVTIIESTFDRTLLEDYERRSGLYLRFDTSEILRTTEKELVETTSNLVEKGLISLNEARAKLDYKRIDKDYFVLNLGSALKDAETGDITVVNLGQTIPQGGSTPNENGTTK